MSRRNGHRSTTGSARRVAAPTPDTPREMQAASLTSPFFRSSWERGSRVTWQQFIQRWECRLRAPAPPDDRP